MPATVVRNPEKLGLTKLSSNVTVAEDGLVRVTAQFLAPSTGLAESVFQLDSSWPVADLPIGLPPSQGGPYLVERNIRKENGLTLVDATYATALSTIRFARSEATELATFSGFAEGTVTDALSVTTGGGALAFDYYATSVTLSYALIAPNAFTITPSGLVSQPFNIRKQGLSQLVKTKQRDLISTSRETVGRVMRVSVTARRIIEQDSGDEVVTLTTYNGASTAAVVSSNPWQL
jgi:hypothetical protein